MSDQATSADLIFGDPQQDPEVTEPTEVVEPPNTEGDADTSDELQSEEVTEGEEATEEESVEETEESEEDKDPEDTDEETVLVLDLDGTDVSLDEVRAWRDGHMLQKEFTQKRMADARVEKQNLAEQDRLSNQSDRMKATTTVLTSLLKSIKDQGFHSDEEIAEFDGQVKSITQSLADDRLNTFSAKAEDERQMLFKRNKDWLNDAGNALSEKGETQVKLINEYFASEGFNKAEVDDIINHKLMIAIHKAAQFDALKKKTVKLKTKVKLAPVVSKPKSKPKAPPTPKTAEEAVFGPLN